MGKNVLIVVVPVLINKDVFEPSYNDLKFNSPKLWSLFHQPNVSYEIPKWPSDDHSEKLSDLYTVLENRPSKTGPSSNLGHNQISQEISLFLKIHNAQ